MCPCLDRCVSFNVGKEWIFFCCCFIEFGWVFEVAVIISQRSKSR